MSARSRLSMQESVAALVDRLAPLPSSGCASGADKGEIGGSPSISGA
jgi:hypothetical protein